MGGHAAGDIASSLVVETLGGLDGRAVLEVDDLKGCISGINNKILEYGFRNPASAGLGSTLSGVAYVTVAGADHWAVFNVGDSRVYRLASGRLSRATVDHSEVENLILAGELTAEQARSHSSRNIITRSLGSNPAPEPDVWLLPRGSQELYLVCSDGLTNELLDDEIASILIASETPQDCVDRLIESALDRGARDNVSAVVVATHDQAEVDERTIPREDSSGGEW
jgi:protein phosphatase